MNFIVKHVLVSVAIHQAVKYTVPLLERFIAKYGTTQHEEYVEHITELWNAKFEAFLLRNANLAEQYSTPSVPDFIKVFNDEDIEKAKQAVRDLFNDLRKNTEPDQ